MVEYFSATRWDGAVDLSWYDGTDTEFTITTARQLAGVAELVNSNTTDFAGKTIRLGADLYLLSYLPALMNGWPEDPLCLTVGGLCIDWSIFAVFAAPLIFCATHSRIKINRWFFYAFYPAHLAAIALAGNIL